MITEALSKTYNRVREFFTPYEFSMMVNLLHMGNDAQKEMCIKNIMIVRQMEYLEMKQSERFNSSEFYFPFSYKEIVEAGE